MDESHEKSPIKTEESQVVSFSIHSLRNPSVSLDPNKSGEYLFYIYKAQELLRRVQETGLWLPSQAKAYAKNYLSLNNAFEVMRRNTLLEHIVEDKPMDGAWSYEEGKDNDLVYEELDKVVHFNKLNNLDKEGIYDREKIEEEVSKANIELQTLLGADVVTSIEHVHQGFWRIRLSRTIENEDYTFYVNIDTNEGSVALLSYIPPTEIVYAFGNLKSVPLIRVLLERHPRLNIQLPPGIEDRIRSRRKNEREYQEKVSRLSATGEISKTEKSFKSGIYVEQGELKIIYADKGPIGTNGVGPCIAICARGVDREGKIIVGLAHMDAGLDENDVLSKLEKCFGSLGVPRNKMEIFLVGGWRSAEELQRRLLALTDRFNIKGVKFNLKGEGIEYPEERNYIDVVVDTDGKILWGENGEVFKVKNENSSPSHAVPDDILQRRIRKT